MGVLTYGNTDAIVGILYGIKPAVTAIVLFVAYRIRLKPLNNNVLRGLAASAFLAIFIFKIPFLYIIIAAGLIGFLGTHFSPNTFKMSAQHSSNNDSYGAALIDDNTSIPEHAKFKYSHLIVFSIVGIDIGFGAFSLLSNSVLHDMGEFFTKAAMLTFGGAYAVLPYVYQGGVEQYGWLTGTQIIDGLALVRHQVRLLWW